MRRSTLIRGIPAGVFCAALAILINWTPFGQALDDWFFDACFVFRGPRTTSAKIVIICIDEASLDELAKPAAYISPELGRAIRYAAQQGASAIGLDFFIPESLSNLPDIEKDNGQAVALAADETARLVMPLFIDKEGTFRKPLSEWQGPVEREDKPTPYGLLNLTTDPDLFVRRQMLVLDPVTFGSDKPSFFALALYARSSGSSASREGRTVRLENRQIPVDEQGRMRINFLGPAGISTFTNVALNSVLAAEREKQKMPVFTGATVIIGVKGAGQQDIHPTPYSNGAARLFSNATVELTPGPEIHAHAIATIHDEAYLTRPKWLEPSFWALLAGIVLGPAFTRVSPSRGLAALAGLLLVVLAGAYVLFVSAGLLLNPVPLALTVLSTYTLVLGRRWWQLRRIFAVVKSEEVTRALEADPRRLDPGGELREVSALFADIRGFTAFSERCQGDPQKVVGLLNAYYSVIIPTIEVEGGTIIAFMGDGLMVLFGAPVSLPDHATRAVRAALALEQAVRDRADLWANHKFSDMRVGVGIHSGPAVIGAIGSGKRKDYTAIGDTINTASRVESETKKHKAAVLITASTMQKLIPVLAARCQAIAGPVTLSGRQEPTQLFRVA